MILKHLIKIINKLKIVSNCFGHLNIMQSLIAKHYISGSVLDLWQATW